MPKTALVIGATGLVGRAIVQHLLNDQAISKITILVRRLSDLNHQKINEVVVDFDKLADYKEQIRADHIYCTMGTTMAIAGSKQAFFKVDYTYPLKTAEIAIKNGAEIYSIVTAVGANARSSVFYSRTKGELEEAIKKLSFKGLHIYQPSFLTGDRQDGRTGESLGISLFQSVSFLMQGPLKTYRPIAADVVAKCMIYNCNINLTGNNTFDSAAIQELYDNNVA